MDPVLDRVGRPRPLGVALPPAGCRRVPSRRRLRATRSSGRRGCGCGRAACPSPASAVRPCRSAPEGPRRAERPPCSGTSRAAIVTSVACAAPAEARSRTTARKRVRTTLLFSRVGATPLPCYARYCRERRAFAPVRRPARRGGRAARARRARPRRAAPRARDPLRHGGQPGHAGLPVASAEARRQGRVQRRGDRARHAGRALRLDAEDRPGRAREPDPGDRLRLAGGRAGRLRGRLDRRGRRPARDGAADEHRLLDADQRRPARTSAATSAARSSTTRPPRCARSRRATAATRSGPTWRCGRRRTSPPPRRSG